MRPARQTRRREGGRWGTDESPTVLELERLFGHFFFSFGEIGEGQRRIGSLRHPRRSQGAQTKITDQAVKKVSIAFSLNRGSSGPVAQKELRKRF